MDDLAASGRLHHAMVELTTGCNLRCVYCAVSGPDWKPKNLDLNLIDKIIEDLKELGTKVIILHGHGETTIIEGWEKIAEKFLAAGFDLSICTNLMKSFTDEEFEILSRFGQITVSIDTIDPTLFRQLRSGGNVHHLIYNMVRLQSLQKIQKREIRWIWSTVVCDQSVWTLFPLVQLGQHLGVKVFCFCNLTIEPGVTLRHVSQLEKSEAERALAILDHVEGYCLQNGLEADIKAGLTDTLKRVVYGTVRDPNNRRLYPLVS